VRDKIQSILEESTPEKEIPGSLFERIHELDGMLWAERETFLIVVGEKELRHARQQQRSPRAHWWWYLDELKILPHPLQEQRGRLARVFVSASG